MSYLEVTESSRSKLGSDLPTSPNPDTVTMTGVACKIYKFCKILCSVGT